MASVTVRCSVCREEKEWPDHLRNRRYRCCAECWARRVRAYRLKNVEASLMAAAKKRAKEKGVPFRLTLEDIKIPKRCPVLKRRFHVKNLDDPKRSFAHPYSPSIDRIVPRLGYVPGNIRVISHRANSIRGDATLAEIEKLYNYLKETV